MASYEIYYDKSYQTWSESDVLSYGLKKKYKPVAVIGTNKPLKILVLFELNSFDKTLVKSIRTKPDETICRFATKMTAYTDSMPLIKVNIKKGLAYYLTEESLSGEIDEPQFKTSGEKLAYARVLQDTNLVKEDNSSVDSSDVINEDHQKDYLDTYVDYLNFVISKKN